jgi:ADP-dependent phosphofructokinase/glucokinase
VRRQFDRDFLPAADGPVVLGMAGAVDYEITWSARVLEDMVARHGIGIGELSQDRPIECERDLVAVILSFLAEGAGGERHVASSAIIEEFAAQFDLRIALGGTAVRAAFALQALGVPCLLHLVAVDDFVRRLLPDTCAYITSAREDSTHPHLIVQFPKGASVRVGDVDVCAPRPNRLIFANDPPAEELRISEDLGAALADAEIFLISSLNAIRDPRLLDARLTELRQYMERLSPHAVVYYEDAGFHAPELNRRACDGLRGAVDVHGMNEEEMQTYIGDHLNLLDADEMAVALCELHSLIAGPTLVVHTRYWALALGSNVQTYEPALRGGVTMATTRYIHGDGLTAADYGATRLRPLHPAGAAFAEEIRGRLGERVRCMPAVQSSNVAQPTTVGLGDAFVGGFLAALVGAHRIGQAKPARPHRSSRERSVS